MFLTVRRKVITGKIITRTLNFILSFEICSIGTVEFPYIRNLKSILL